MRNEGTNERQFYTGEYVHDLNVMVIDHEWKNGVKVECNFLKVLHYAAGKKA